MQIATSTPTPQNAIVIAPRNTIQSQSVTSDSFGRGRRKRRIIGKHSCQAFDGASHFQIGHGANSINQCNNFVNRPDVIGDARLHRWRHAEALMDASEIVIHVMERQHVLVVLHLFTEAV